MQKFFTRRRSLARKAAAMMSAVMLFTSEAGVFLQNGIVANAADDEVQEDAAVEETAAEESGVVTASDGNFSVTVSKLQYGEDGSNENGNLDAVFSPQLLADGTELKLGNDYSVSYKFFTDKDAAEAVSKETFDEAEGVELAKVNAGTDIYAVVKAAAADAEYMVTVKLTVAKRVISVSYKASAEAAIEGRDVAEDGSYVIAAEDVDYSGFDLSFADGFAYELDASAFLSGDVTLDLSDVDLSEDSFSSVPMNVELDPELEDNYELDQNIHGDYYINKAQYYVVFTANNDGQTYSKTYAFPSYDFNGTAAELLNTLGKTDEILSQDDGIYTLNGFVNPVTDTLVGWTAYIDGFNADKARDYADYYSGYSYSTVNVNADASTYESSGSKKTLKLSGKRDYLFVAEISKAAASNLYVSVIPSVFYDSRAHVALGTKAKGKKEVADLRIKVNYSTTDKQSGVESSTQLTCGKDYTIQYFNNTDASMAVSENGTYVPVKTGDARPHVKITGKDSYNGFEATVYFDILPVNLGASEWTYDYLHEKDSSYYDGYNYERPYTYMASYKADFSGISKDTYVLKKGKISGINPKVTKHFYSYGYDKDYARTSNYTYATINLVQGKDYQLELYKWNVEGSFWELKEGVTDPNKLTEAGDYLCLVRGIGNFCGALFEGNEDNEFASGKDTGDMLNPIHDPAFSQQFRIADNMDKDISTASISVGTKSVNWDGSLHDAVSFNIVVKDKSKNELKLGEDYYAYFINKYGNRNGVNNGPKVSASNTYEIYIEGVGDYYGSKKGGKVSIKGTKLKKNWFKLDQNYYPQLTEAGIAAGVVLGPESDPHYVGYYTYTNSGSNKRNIQVGGNKYKWYVDSSNSLSGEAFDPQSKVKFSYTPSFKKMTLSEAINKGYFKFTVSDNGVYNVKGAVPDNIRVEYGKGYSNSWYASDLYSGYHTSISLYNPDGINYYGSVPIKFTFKNNKKLGGKATVVAKVDGKNNYVTGSATIGTYTVGVKEVEAMGYYNNYMPDVYGMSPSSVFAVVTDALRSKGSLSKPNVKLYQVYRDKYGIQRAAALGAKQYKIVAGDELGTNHIAVSTYAANGSAKGFDFKAVYDNPGVYSGVFALYNSKLTAADVSMVAISGLTEYAVKSGVIDNAYAPSFTGRMIAPYVPQFNTAKGSFNYGEDYYLGYGENIAAGDKSGVIVFSMHYNYDKDTYEYGGSADINFKITAVDGIVL